MDFLILSLIKAAIVAFVLLTALAYLQWVERKVIALGGAASLVCQRHGIRSQVSDKADWTIPASWSGCFINVTGTPGTKFSFVEMAPAAGGTAKPAAP